MASAELHRWARKLYTDGLIANSGAPLLSEIQAVQGISLIESTHGKGWKGAGVGSFNMGAIQGGRPPCNPASSFVYTDTHPNADGSSTPYSICFRKYATAQAGAEDLIRVAYDRRPKVLAAASRGDFYGVSAELHASGYYEGFGSTVAARINNHFKALCRAINEAALVFGEPGAIFVPLPPSEPWQDDVLEDNPLILRGSHGRYVKVWQGDILNVWLQKNGAETIASDGMFGPITTTITKNWQLAQHLKNDGKVGPITWGKAAELAEAA